MPLVTSVGRGLGWVGVAVRGGCVLAAVAFVAAFILVAVLRLRYPFELEWMEGGSVEHVRRLLDGRPIYVKPSLEFTPFLYTPLYYYVCAGLGVFAGAGLAQMRLVSLACSVGVLATLYVMGRRETGSRTAGIVAAGLFAATYRLSGAFLDVARVDSLCLLLLLMAVSLVRLRRSAAHDATAGLLLAAAVMTKQTALFVAVPLLAWSLIANVRRGALLTVTAVAAAVLAAGSLQIASGGWFGYYAFDLPRRHMIDWAAAGNFWRADLLAPLPIAVLGAFACLVWPRPGLPWGDRLFYPVVAAAMLGSSWLGKANYGGYGNTLLPAYAILSLLAAMGMHAVLASAAPSQSAGRLCVYAACLVQFALLMYDTGKCVPESSDRHAGDKLVEIVRRADGDVFAPTHLSLVTAAGRRPSAHMAAINEVVGVFGGRGDSVADELKREIRDAVHGKRFGAILIDPACCEWLRGAIEESYVVRPDGVYHNPRTFLPVTGCPVRPESVYVPRR
jgi:hypothetical protein